MTIERDTKDWTWVLSRPCPECGFDASALEPRDLPAAIETNAFGWSRVLSRPDARTRPAPTVWSPAEYACHVRDVHRVFEGRVRLMLTEDDPTFANWDQDETAVEDQYHLQDPAQVSRELVEAAAEVAQLYAAVTGDQWERTGRRSNGAEFSVDTLGRYHLHDAVHHLWDVGPPALDAGDGA